MDSVFYASSDENADAFYFYLEKFLLDIGDYAFELDTKYLQMNEAGHICNGLAGQGIFLSYGNILSLYQHRHAPGIFQSDVVTAWNLRRNICSYICHFHAYGHNYRPVRGCPRLPFKKQIILYA